MDPFPYLLNTCTIAFPHPWFIDQSLCKYSVPRSMICLSVLQIPTDILPSTCASSKKKKNGKNGKEKKKKNGKHRVIAGLICSETLCPVMLFHGTSSNRCTFTVLAAAVRFCSSKAALQSHYMESGMVTAN